MTDSVIQSFVNEQRELLALELEAETSENDNVDNEERASHILGNLEASDVSVGLYGRTVVQLTLWSEKTPASSSSTSNNNAKHEPILPAHRFTVGDEVEIRSKQKSSGKGYPGGVVSAVSDTFVSIALFQSLSQKTNSESNNGDEEGEDGVGAAPLTLVPRSSADVHRKLLQALDTLEKKGVNHPIAGHIIQAMFFPDSFKDLPVKGQQEQTLPFRNNLDQSQKEAISFALQSDRPIALIHGPPGTGKTTTVAELIQQAVHVHGMKVLVTAPSNVAVDNILERLVEPTSTATTKGKGKRKNGKSRMLRAVRLGHPARIKSSILSYSLEALVQQSDGTDIVAGVRKELQSYLRVASNPKSRPGDKRAAYREIKSLRSEVRSREEKVVQELISTAQVVLATTVGAANRILEKVEKGFDLVIIDEAAQALEASCWIPILRGKKVVLAGDHCQLPPTIKSKNNRAQRGLGKTMFERLMELYEPAEHSKNTPPRISRMLNIQYRMHEDIANWASKAMYHGELKTHDSVRKRTLSQMDNVRALGTDEDSILNTTLLLVDTAGCDMHERVNPAGSRYNEGEADIVSEHVRTLFRMGLTQQQVCIISPYNGQVELLRNMLKPEFPMLEIRSVDGFQGGERDAVILSLVRSSDRGGKDGIGFLRDDRRQNVAVTRAKRHLMVVCDSETVSRSKFIGTLISWMQEHGEQRSAMEYQSTSQPDDADLRVAEEELLKLVESSKSSPLSKQNRFDSKLGTPSARQQAKPQDQEKRKALMDRIANFLEEGNAGEEMVLSTELSSFDRRLVHEFAEQNGLGHRSEGVQGEDRRIVLTIVKPVKQAPPPDSPGKKEETSNTPDADYTEKTTSAFEALALVDSDSSEDEDDTNDGIKSELKEAIEPGQVMNAMFAQLAKERAERQKLRENTQVHAPPKARKAKGKGQKLGGAKKPEKKETENLDHLDDMAFLDVQIEKAQNAHGRKVQGSGKAYRTIVNGILNAGVEPRQSTTNKKASATLQSKLKEAQNARKSKGPQKKKN